MADSWGVDDGYLAVDGRWHDTPDDVRRSLRVAMGGLADSDDPPPRGRPVWFVGHGDAAPIDRPAQLVLEDGTAVRADAALPPDLPLGYHDLHPSDGGPATRVIVVPRRAAPAPVRVAAVAVQLYAARSRSSWGIGDLGDLLTIARWAARRGATGLLLSPLHAPIPSAAPEPSPYFASSRCWRSPLHLRIQDVPGFDLDRPALAALARRGLALNRDDVIDRDAVWALKRSALGAIWERLGGAAGAGSAFETWRKAEGADLERFATFGALAEHHGSGWTSWPVEHRRPDTPAVARYASANADAVAFHAWLQWLADNQHARAAARTTGVGLVHDLAVGSDPDGADAWCWQDVVAPGVRVGAPPDAFNEAGQDWSLPPFVPWRLRSAAYEPLARMLRASFRHAAGLRVDHIMGLFRLWWIPRGRAPAEGGYVRFPGHELLDILALESVRAGAFVVGEDLGTVEDEVRAALRDRGVLSYRVAWFEEHPPETWPKQALAALTTHDLPTLAGVWSGVDDPGGAMGPRLHGLLEGTGLPPTAPVTEVAVAAHRRLAAAPSQVASATLEDLVGVTERPNVPGTTTEHPNWSKALPVPVDDLGEDGPAAAALDALVDGRD